MKRKSQILLIAADGLCFDVAIPTEPNGLNHTTLFTKAAGTDEAHKVTLTVTKALAAIGARIVIDDSFATHVRPILPST
jgi:hypothetical protein